MSATSQTVLASLADLLTGRKMLVVKPRDPERLMTAGGFTVRVEDVRGRG